MTKDDEKRHDESKEELMDFIDECVIRHLDSKERPTDLSTRMLGFVDGFATGLAKIFYVLDQSVKPGADLETELESTLTMLVRETKRRFLLLKKERKDGKK